MLRETYRSVPIPVDTSEDEYIVKTQGTVPIIFTSRVPESVCPSGIAYNVYAQVRSVTQPNYFRSPIWRFDSRTGEFCERVESLDGFTWIILVTHLQELPNTTFDGSRQVYGGNHVIQRDLSIYNFDAENNDTTGSALFPISGWGDFNDFIDPVWIYDPINAKFIMPTNSLNQFEVGVFDSRDQSGPERRISMAGEPYTLLPMNPPYGLSCSDNTGVITQFNYLTGQVTGIFKPPDLDSARGATSGERRFGYDRYNHRLLVLDLIDQDANDNEQMVVRGFNLSPVPYKIMPPQTSAEPRVGRSVKLWTRVITQAGQGLGQQKVTFSGSGNFDVVYTASQDAGASATSVTITEPAGTVEDDLIIVLCKNDATGSTWTDPADFTQLEVTDATSNQRFYLGYKVRGATQGSGYTFSHSFGGGTNTAGIMVVVRNQNATPFDVTYVKASHFTESVDDLSYAPSAITTQTDDALVLILSGYSGGPGLITWGAPSGYTTEVALEAGSSRNLHAVSKAIPTAGTETPGEYTTTGDAGEDGASFTLAIRSETSPGVGTIAPLTAITDEAGYAIVDYDGGAVGGPETITVSVEQLEGAFPPSSAQGSGADGWVPEVHLDFNGQTVNSDVSGIIAEQQDWTKGTGGFGTFGETTIKRPSKSSSAELRIESGATTTAGTGGGTFGGSLVMDTLGSSNPIGYTQRGWVGAWVYFPTGFDFTDSTGLRLFRLQDNAIGTTSNFVLRLKHTAGAHTGYTLQWPDQTVTDTRHDFLAHSSVLLTPDTWHFIQYSWLMHPTDAVCEQRLWIDDLLIWQLINDQAQYRDSGGGGSLTSFTANEAIGTSNSIWSSMYQLEVLNVWGGAGAPATQSCYLGNVVWSRDPTEALPLDELGARYISSQYAQNL